MLGIARFARKLQPSKRYPCVLLQLFGMTDWLKLSCSLKKANRLVTLSRIRKQQAEVEIRLENLWVDLQRFLECRQCFGIMVQGLLAIAQIVPGLIALWIFGGRLLKY